MFGPTFALHHTSLSVQGTSSTASLSGTGLGFDLELGGTITRGLVLGGAYGHYSVSNTTLRPSDGATTSDVSTSYNFIGLIAEYFPLPSRPFHVGAGLWRAYLSVERLTVGPLPPSTPGGQFTTSDASSMSGIHAHFQAGIGGYVSSEWAVGVLARLQLAHVSNTDGVASGFLITPSLSLAFTYH
jgi:hypothetical protein